VLHLVLLVSSTGNIEALKIWIYRSIRYEAE
jgi:hypothetical protein